MINQHSIVLILCLSLAMLSGCSTKSITTEKSTTDNGTTHPTTNTGSDGNPLNFDSNIKTADPSAHVWPDGKMYLYTSHDEECQPDFYMKNWHTFSSEDLVNWVDHGSILSVEQ